MHNPVVGHSEPMIIYGLDSIATLLEQDGYVFKLLANDTGVVFSPTPLSIATQRSPASSMQTIRAATLWQRW